MSLFFPLGVLKHYSEDSFALFKKRESCYYGLQITGKQVEMRHSFLRRGIMKKRNIQMIICFVMLFLAAGRAGAAEWMLYGSSTIGTGYYDKSSVIKVNDHVIRVLTKTILNDVGKLQNYSALRKKGKAPGNPYILNYEIALLDIDCPNAKIKISSSRICDKRGNVIASEPASHDQWHKVVPGSHLEKLKNEVCSTVNISGIKKK
jgi:hypothetical protein